MDLRGKTVFITGAAGGIGDALARRIMAEEPAGIAIVDRTAESLESLAAETGAIPIAADLASQAGVEAAIDEATAAIGPIDVCVSNAGILIEGGPEVPTEDWQKIWDINVMAHVHAARVLVPQMIERGGGHFIHTASAAGLLSQIGSAPYAVTKAAAVSFAEWLAITYGADNIGVSALCPQAVDTAMLGGSEDGGVAGVDGVMSPADVAEAVIEGLRDGRFLILPHPAVAIYAERKGADRDRWIAGMQRLQAQFG